MAPRSQQLLGLIPVTHAAEATISVGALAASGVELCLDVNGLRPSALRLELHTIS